jgi:Asp-tRNA(Asn)/Glu-tRNA(Gln) amidotransferase C subunit
LAKLIRLKLKNYEINKLVKYLRKILSYVEKFERWFKKYKLLTNILEGLLLRKDKVLNNVTLKEIEGII